MGAKESIPDETQPEDTEDTGQPALMPEAFEKAINKAIRESMTDTPGELPSYMRNSTAREAFTAAFELVGGVPRLALWANANYGRFMAIYARMLPLTLSGDPNQPITVIPGWLTGARFNQAPSPEQQQSQLPAPLPVDYGLRVKEIVPGVSGDSAPG